MLWSLQLYGVSRSHSTNQSFSEHYLQVNLYMLALRVVTAGVVTAGVVTARVVTAGEVTARVHIMLSGPSPSGSNRRLASSSWLLC